MIPDYKARYRAPHVRLRLYELADVLIERAVGSCAVREGARAIASADVCGG
jgi:hypothetical protein